MVDQIWQFFLEESALFKFAEKLTLLLMAIFVKSAIFKSDHELVRRIYVRHNNVT